MSTGVQKGYAGLRALLVSTPRSHPGCFDAEWNPFDAMSSALWLMEAHGRKWSVPQDNATAIRHLEYFQKSSSWLKRVLAMLLCLNRVGMTPNIAVDLVGDVLQAEIVNVFKEHVPDGDWLELESP